MLLSLAVAFVMGSMTLRMRGVFFALATVRCRSRWCSSRAISST